MLTMKITLKMKLVEEVIMGHFFFIVFLAGITFPALAHDLEGKSKKIDFSEMKKSRLEKLDKMRTCISKAEDFKQLRACKPKKK